MTHLIRTAVAVVVAATAAAAATADGQSLGDLAKKEEARRKQSTAGKVYTNDNLRPAPPASATPTPDASASQQAPPAAGQAPAPAAGAAPAQVPDASPKHDQVYWRDRMTTAREGLERARVFHDALQSRINALTTDFVSRDDPAQRSVVASDRQKALDELERVKKEIAGFEKQLRDIEDEARRAGVPPGWLR